MKLNQKQKQSMTLEVDKVKEIKRASRQVFGNPGKQKKHGNKKRPNGEFCECCGDPRCFGECSEQEPECESCSTCSKGCCGK